MIYVKENGLLIRNMQQDDAQYFATEEREQGWNSQEEKFFCRLRDQADGKAIALVAEYNGRPAGYVSVYFQAHGAYLESGFPEIVDFGVLEKYQRRGVGTKMMDIAEHIASEYSDTVCLGVGVHCGYGSAQRMYVKRGYIPDGTGVWYQDKVCAPYTPCKNDDSLIIYMSKRLR